MKRLALRDCLALASLATCAVSATSVLAEERAVAVDQMGRVTIDTESVQPQGRYVVAGFWAYTGDARVPVIAMIDGCANRGGRIGYRVLDPEDPDRSANVSAWNSGGDRIIDKMAAAACQHAKHS
jgi:hypothetical protein